MNKIYTKKNLWLVLLVLAASCKLAAQEHQQKQDAQEIYLSFNYGGVVNTVVTGLYYQDSVYLPIDAIFSLLSVNREIDTRSGTIRGFFLDQENPYEVNFESGLAKIGKRELTFDTSKVIREPLDFYILPSLFQDIFNLDFAVDFSSLSLSLDTQEELPIVRDYQREVRRKYLVSAPQASLIQAPLIFPRQRQLLNGGVLDYSLSAFQAGGLTGYNYSLNGGAELLGGEAEGAILGSISQGNSRLYSSNLSWKYVFDSSTYITNVGIGNLYSNGLTQYGFRGVQLSNEPATIRTMFSSYVINAYTSPNWDAELYLNGQLVDYAKADAQGNARFTIPLIYGTSFVQLKYYGPDGEFSESDRRFQIPFTFNPPGQVNYDISAGKLNNSDYNFMSGDVLVGITDWLSDKLGMDYVDEPSFSKPLIYNSLSMRFSPEYILSMNVAPSAIYQTTFNAIYASQAAFDIVYSRYRENMLFNPGGKLQELQGDAYLPFSVGNSGFNFRLAGSAQQYVNGQEAFSYSAYSTLSVPQFNASVGYVGSVLSFVPGSNILSSNLTASLLYSLFFSPGQFQFLNGTLIEATARYGLQRNSLDDIRIEASRNIQRYVRIAVSAERDFVNKLTTFNLQVIADLPFTRSTTNAQIQNGSSWYNENLSGSVGFDGNYGRFILNDLGWVGHSAASMRMFIDANGNGVYDDGEQVIKDGSVRMRQATASETSSDGVVREWNLLPYTQYSADIDINTIRNPLWIPKEKSFSFVTDPNSFKRVDVPFFVGGVVDGTVLEFNGTALVAVPRLTLEIKSLTSDLSKAIGVFNDGTFYYMGLPPGNYIAYVDSSQLSILDARSDPSVLTFSVKSSETGDFVEGLQIRLVRNSPALTEKVSAKRFASEAAVAPVVQKSAPAPVTAKYIVQIGAFSSFDHAVAFARRAGLRTLQRMNVRVNCTSHLYVVQTDTGDSKQASLDMVDALMNKYGYRDAFVVSTNVPDSACLYSIQVGALHSLSSAVEFSHKTQRATGLEATVRFEKTNQLFSVRIGPFSSKAEADRVLSSLRKIRSYKDAFVAI